MILASGGSVPSQVSRSQVAFVWKIFERVSYEQVFGNGGGCLKAGFLAKELSAAMEPVGKKKQAEKKSLPPFVKAVRPTTILSPSASRRPLTVAILHVRDICVLSSSLLMSSSFFQGLGMIVPRQGRGLESLPHGIRLDSTRSSKLWALSLLLVPRMLCEAARI